MPKIFNMNMCWQLNKIKLISKRQHLCLRKWQLLEPAKTTAVATNAFSTVSTQFDAGWKRRATKPTKNGFLPIEHETTQPTQPTWNVT